MRTGTLLAPALLALVACTVDPAPSGGELQLPPGSPVAAPPAVTTHGPGAKGHAFAPPPYAARPRSACLRVAGSVEIGETTLAGAEPAALDVSETCLESGHRGEAKGVFYTDKDNPLVWTKTTLQRWDLPTGARVGQDYLRDDTGYRVGHGDLNLRVSGGDEALDLGALSTTSRSLAADLFPWTASAGSWAAPSSMVTVSPGLRLGGAPESIQLAATRPTGGEEMAAFPTTVALDPNVLLVPIQAVLFYPDGQDALGRAFAAGQLALWDRVPTVGARSAFSADGGTTGTAQLLSNVVAKPAPATARGFTLPDDVWAPCGVQFRLVNVMPMRVPQALLSPKGHSSLSGTLDEMYQAIRADARFQENRLTVLFAPHCSDVEGGTGVLPPAGQSSIAHRFACVMTSAQTPVLAHELGHVIMGTDGHVEAKGKDATNLMVEVPMSGIDLDHYKQCRDARDHLTEAKLFMR